MGRNSNSYSTRGEPQVAQLLDTEINFNTLTAGDVLTWEATEEVWINAAGGGGGGGIVGTDDDALFKQGGNANTFTNGITRNPANTGRALTLDTANLRLGIGGSGVATNPTNTLEVQGTARVASGTDELEINGEKIGLIAGTNKLALFNNNLPAVPSGLVQVDSLVKQLESSSFRSYDPDNFDVANTTDIDSIYKIKLQDGTTRQSVPTTAFDIQEPFRPLSFPTGQIVEYQNKVPLCKPICISRNLGPQIIAPAAVRVVSSLGSRRNAPFFDDGMHYDPCNMRAKLTGTGWNSFGAPVEYRVADLKVGWTITWNIHATWTGPGAPLNRGDVYIVQYRNGVVLYNHLVQQLEQDGESWWCGTKTFMGWDATAGEDFDVLTDYYEVELANLAAVDLQYNSARCEAECWIAQ